MKDKNQDLEALQDIRNMMHRSSRFISLSGLSGVCAGVYALMGATYAYWHLQSLKGNPFAFLNSNNRSPLIFAAAFVLIISAITAVVLTIRKARKNNHAIWDQTSRRLIINLLLPLAVGGVFCIVLLHRCYFDLLAASMLIFYGLSLLNASKFTLHDIRFLGFAQIALGCVALFLPDWGLFLWALGFGVFHIIYGVLMYYKYE